MSTVVVHLLPPNEYPFGLGRPKCNSMVAAMSEYNYDLWEDDEVEKVRGRAGVLGNVVEA